MTDRRRLVLNLFIYPGGHHEAAWRYKESVPERVFDITYYQDLAQRAEAAKFDAVFFADGPALADNIRYAARFRVEPITWLTAIAAVTKRIGLIATASTTYNEPYNLARLFASLDHISGGRAGWNIVTTSAPQAAQNFGLPEHPPHNERYEKAREFLDVITKLWDSWEDDAVVNDPVSGIFADAAKIHPINHVGRHFRVRGPFNTARSPQGRPVYVQAGSSDDGRSFAAQHAEAIFTAHQTLASAQEFYTDIKARARAFDRNPDHVKILPGLSPFIGSTTAEAKRLQEEFNDLIQPDYSLTQLPGWSGSISPPSISTARSRAISSTPAGRAASPAASSSSSTSSIARSRPSANWCSALPAPAAISCWRARRRKSPTISRVGSRAARPTASTSCRRG